MSEPEALKIAVCEDVSADAALLSGFIKKSGFACECRNFENGEDFLKSFKAGMYDLVFMDIYMKGMLGTETVEMIRRVDKKVTIAFTTSSPCFTLDGYRLDVMKYLEKPISEKAVSEIIESAFIKKKYRPAITIKVAGGGQTEVFLDTILYFEHRNHVVELHTTEKVIVTSQSARLDEFAKRLPSPPFLRCHRSFIVNLDYVDKPDKELKAFIMKNGHQADIRQVDFGKYKAEFQKWLLTKAGRDEI